MSGCRKRSPASGFTTVDLVVNGPVLYDGGNGATPHGYDIMVFAAAFFGAGPGDLALTSFRRYLPSRVNGTGAMGETQLPFVFEGVGLAIGIESWRGAGMPASFEEMFGPGYESIIQGLPHDPASTCYSATSSGYAVVP